ncbi:MAG: hypothetical protein AB1Z19_05675, partial [Eubacteriales bacterium]
PSASPSATPSVAPISSLEYAQNLALGEGYDINAYDKEEVLVEELLDVLTLEDAPMILVQTGEETFAVITGYEVDEEGVLISLTLTDVQGDTILGGTDGILKAWVYVAIEPEASEEPSAEPSASPSGEPSEQPSPEPEASEAPVASEEPAASEAPEASEAPAVSETPVATVAPATSASPAA